MASSKTYDGFICNLKKSNLLLNKDIDQKFDSELIDFHNSVFVLKDETLGKRPIRYVYDFICYGVDDNWCGRIRSMISLGSAHTKERQLLKYGIVEGLKRWESYKDIQAKSNTFEYKNNKYGMTKDEFDVYNKSRSVTLVNLIKKHGEAIGIQKWDAYCERQRYTCSFDYFISEYGYECGSKKFESFVDNRPTFYNDGHIPQNTRVMVSKLEMDIFEVLLTELDITSQVTFERTEGNYYGPFDFGSKADKKLIEVYGDFWHMNPNKYVETDINEITGLSAKQKWAFDRNKNNMANKKGFDVFVIWESEWHSDKSNVLSNIRVWFNEKRDNR